MNKRQIQKYRKSNWKKSVLYPWSRYHCMNWGLACACGHPDSYGKDDYSDYDMGCREMHFVVNSFRKLLKREHNCIEIYATDMKWKYHKGMGFNADRFNTIKDALKTPYQVENWRL